MSSRPPLDNREVYDLLHEMWLRARSSSATSEEGRHALDAIRKKLVDLQKALLIVEDYRERTGDTKGLDDS